MPGKRYFNASLFRFLSELKANNNRQWFEANKARYIKDVRDPMREFVTDFAPPLQQISPYFISDPRPVGGTIFRIYRDIRFARDKSPYKTMTAAQFKHESWPDAHGPVFYLHLEPGSVFFSAGIWHPDALLLGKVRDAIAAAPERWESAAAESVTRGGLVLEGDSLKRLPKGYDPAHPLAEVLMRKDFLVSLNLEQQDAYSPKFLERFTGFCKTATPVVRFITLAGGLPW